jgi:UDP-2,4-diacetamido-2,4,6-trideoxy-beta-L-altropyranose hydrolase
MIELVSMILPGGSLRNVKQKFALRVDASSEIGTGHFMRCLTLADALKARGAQTRFVSRHLPEHLRSKLAAQGHEFALIDTPRNNGSLDELTHASWLGVSQVQDARDTILALSGQNWDWIIVDHYALDARWESKLRQVSKMILAIDDIADRQHDCEILLDQNFYADMETRYIGKVPESCQLLLGPRYALLRDEYRRLHEQVKPRTGPVRLVLVFFGGVDADNYTGRAIEALSGTDTTGIHVDVVIGERHPYREQILAACGQLGFVCHVQTDKMAELMAAADLAIGAGGSACWERCCLGLPALSFCTADNQQEQVADAAGRGLLYAPEIQSDLKQTIQRHFRALIENSHLRQCISRNSMQLVNGRGALRVIASMGCSGIVIRMATLDDSEKLFHWRNHQSIREVSRNTEVIAWNDHQIWFASVLADSKSMLLIGQEAGLPIGVVRFDMQNEDEAEISIYVVPEKLFSGLGRSLLHRAELWLAANHSEINKIRAHVLGDNSRSQRLFSEAGYQVDSTDYSKRLH